MSSAASARPETQPVVSIAARSGDPRRTLAPESSAADVAEACRSAARTLPDLAAAGAAGRARLLRAIADRLDAEVDRLVPVADAETALGEARLRGEVGRSSAQFRLFATVLEDGAWLEATVDHADPDWPAGGRPDLRRTAVPLGVAGVFAASNFPFAFSVAGGDVASALAAGCPVVVKGHPGHPETSQLCAEALRAAAVSAGLPEQVLNLVTGMDAGRALVLDPHVRAVGFTGSVAGGRALYDLAKGRPDPIPFYGELGSINPVVISEAAAQERAGEIGEGLAASFLLGTGQFCTKPGLVLLPAGPAGRDVEEALAAAVRRSPAAHLLLDRIRTAFADGVSARTRLDGVELVAEGGAPDDERQARAAVLAVEAGALAEVDLLAEECFGPLVVLARWRDEAELLDAVSRLPGSLTATVQAGAAETAPDTVAGRATALLQQRAGRLVWNGWPTGVAVTWAMQHGGPWPSSTEPATTSVGTAAISRWVRWVAFQNVPDALLPADLQEGNPLGIPRRVDGERR